MPTKNEPVELYPLDTLETVLDLITRLIRKAGDIARWGLVNRPRLTHLALHGKTARVRKKNICRVTKEYIQEVFNCAENG